MTQQRFDNFMEDLRGLDPQGLIELYLEAKFGKNYKPADDLPLQLFTETIEKIEECLQHVQDKLN